MFNCNQFVFGEEALTKALASAAHAELAAELKRREDILMTGSSGVTDQWRVYTHIINALRLGPPLRLMTQASAGTGGLD